MTFEEWAAFTTGLIMSFIWAGVILAYFRLRQRVYVLEQIVKEKKVEPKEV